MGVSSLIKGKFNGYNVNYGAGEDLPLNLWIRLLASILISIEKLTRWGNHDNL
jgi:hypothetical protein